MTLDRIESLEWMVRWCNCAGYFRDFPAGSNKTLLQYGALTRSVEQDERGFPVLTDEDVEWMRKARPWLPS